MKPAADFRLKKHSVSESGSLFWHHNIIAVASNPIPIRRDNTPPPAMPIVS